MWNVLCVRQQMWGNQMFCCSGAELALKKRFEEAYARSEHSVMQAIERVVCGCDFGGNSWTHREQADKQIHMLGLDEGAELIDLGAGTGWPGLYMAKQTGCAVTLVDLPIVGLDLAQQRAEEEGLSDRIFTRVADAADLPYPAASFDAISHSDLLCCLVRKLAVLEQCRRIIRPGGRMVFTVISVAPGLSQSGYTRALANAPDFVEVEDDYLTLLNASGWLVTDQVDLTKEYENSCARQVEADMTHQGDLAKLLGPRKAEERLAGWHSKFAAIQEGLFLREMFVCLPQVSGA